VATRALTLGAGLGGLLAARALADHYDEVWVLERDAFPPAGEARKGVPQGRHVHALLAAGRRAIERLFPGLAQAVVEQGGLEADIERLRWFDHGGYHARCTGIEALLVSRPRLEAHVRERLAALPNVRIRERCEVLALRAEGTRVTGVRVLANGLRQEEEIRADLVVDAGGRGSHVPAWLERLGFPRPLEDEVQVRLGYSTCLFRRREGDLNGDVGVIVVPTPPSRRGGVLVAIEGGRFILTLFGLLGDHPPIDPEGFRRFAESLPARELGEFIAGAEPLGDPVPFRFPASMRRRYETMTRFPAGLLVFGDAICSFNPIYGQGMSVAALQAEALGCVLAAGPDRLATRFFAEAARIVETPWSMCVGGDLSYPEVPGRRTTIGGLLGAYLSRLRRGAQQDAQLALAFQRVANLIAPPSSLLTPRIALRVLRGSSGRRRQERARSRTERPEGSMIDV
jgi:2-polyprenyl-6-methoxyphenol hydroxylase-like FAD-dependent oxidoreductase